MTTFLVVRHGFSKSNEQGFFTGQRDVPLSDLGLEQAEQTAKYIAENYKVDFLYSSPLQRAYQTALPLSKYCNLPIETMDDLKEINGGEWEGKTPEKILELYKDDYTLWRTNIGLARCTGGESMEEVQTRAANALREVAQKHNGCTIAVTAHAGVIRALQCLWQNRPLSDMQNIPWVENASVSIVHCENGVFSPVAIGYSAHLTTPKTNLRNI